MVFAPSGGVVEGRRPLSEGGSGPFPGGAACTGAIGGAPRPRFTAGGWRCSDVAAGWMPIIVAFFVAMGRICG
ncbi:hypothetical protein, partial [Escherichia coli]|uniref:hypothetical protein n=1 Tax=Escherichia coli TaxID=562 RepID=UPI001BE47136